MVSRIDARHLPVTEPIALEGQVQMQPDYSTPVCHLVSIPTTPPTTVEVTTTINTYCERGESQQDCQARHIAAVQSFLESVTPCPPE